MDKEEEEEEFNIVDNSTFPWGMFKGSFTVEQSGINPNMPIDFSRMAYNGVLLKQP